MPLAKLLLIAITPFFLLTSCGSIHMKTIGATAKINIKECGFPYLSRIDTGASSTSIHAEDLTIKNTDNGQMASFITFNEKGQRQRITSKVVDVRTVRNSQGVEERYYIELNLIHENAQKKVQVNLRDRSKMTYKLLIGRNWLKGDYLVDVSKDTKGQ